MSTYVATEAAVEALLWEYSPYLNTRNVARGSWNVLGASGTDWAVVLTMGAQTEKGDALFGRGSQGKRQERHTIHLEVYRKVRQAADGDGAAYLALTEFIDGLDAHLAAYPRLNGTANVRRAEVSLITEIENIGPPPPAAPTHLRQTLVIAAECEVDRDLSVETPQ